MADDPALANQTTANAQAWGGMSPFVAAAFAINKANSAYQAEHSHVNHQSKLSVPGGAGKIPLPGAELTGAGVPGPLGSPAAPVNNGMPPALQVGVAGPMQGVSLPPTPQAGSLTAPPNHFITGTPNPFGAQSFGI